MAAADPQHRTSTVVVSDNDGERSFTFMVRLSADLFLDAADLRHSAPGSGCGLFYRASAPKPSRSCDVSGDGRDQTGGDSSALIPIFAPILAR